MSFIRYKPFGLHRMKVLIRGDVEFHRLGLVIRQKPKQSIEAKEGDKTLSNAVSQSTEAKLGDVELTQSITQTVEATLV